MKLKERFIKLLNNIGGCTLQDGYPCNSCFHTNVSDELEINDDLTHLLWIIHLVLRDDKDYDFKSVIKSNKEFFIKLSKVV